MAADASGMYLDVNAEAARIQARQLAHALRMAAVREASGQIGLPFDQELVVDLFAGGGGASSGIEEAIGRPVDIAVNHDPAAIGMHAANHSQTKHYIEDVWQVDPLKATGGKPVGLLWASPTCIFFSQAKGGAPLDKEEARRVRGLAWVVVKWAKAVAPRAIMVENVPQFQDWCRLGKDGKADMRYRGEHFKRWVRELRRLGYHVEWKVLKAHDFGAPTIRERVYVVCRRDKLPLTWPEPTHGPGRPLPWRTAAECIDWDEPTLSIFGRKKPLAKNTLARIAKGVVRFVLQNPRPFIVTCNHSGEEFRGQDIDEPMRTITAARDAHGIVLPSVTIFRGGSVGTSLEQPLNTITSGQGSKRKAGAAHAFGLLEAHAAGDASMKAPCLIKYYRDGGQLQSADEPLHTVPTKARFATVEAEVSPFMVAIDNKSSGDGASWSAEDPLRTITKENRHAVAVPVVAPTATGERNITAATMVQTGYGERPGQDPRALDIQQPLGTVVAGGVKHAVIEASAIMVNNANNVGIHPDAPLPTITTGNRHFLASASFIAQHNLGAIGRAADEPLATVTQSGSQQQVVSAHLTHFYGSNEGSSAGDLDAPLSTVTSGGQHQALVETEISAADLKRARRVVRFLKDYYRPSKKDPPLTLEMKQGIVRINGQPYRLVDIRMRMLKPRELYRAQGFPEDYIIDPEATYRTESGRLRRGRLPQHEQVAKCGNSVPPPVAAAIVRANFIHERAYMRAVA